MSEPPSDRFPLTLGEGQGEGLDEVENSDRALTPSARDSTAVDNVHGSNDKHVPDPERELQNCKPDLHPVTRTQSSALSPFDLRFTIYDLPSGDTRYVVVRQRILLDRAHPSLVRLPIIPR